MIKNKYLFIEREGPVLFTVTDNYGSSVNIPEGTTLGEAYNLLKPHDKYPIVLGAINNDVSDFQTIIKCDAHIRWITINTQEGHSAYQRTLILMLVRAADMLFPHSYVRVAHSLGKALYCELTFPDGELLTVHHVHQLEAQMKRIQDEFPDIEKIKVGREETIEYLQGVGKADDAALLEHMERVDVTYYRNGDMADYYFGPMLPSLTYAELFELQHYAPGFLLKYPDIDDPYVLEPYEEIPKFAKVFLEAKQWGRILDCSYVNQLNHYIDTGEITDIIELAEGLQEKKQASIADMIVAQSPAIKLVLIAGPSSAGKTTFTKRLCTQLRINDRKPLMLSLDDYFYERSKTPKLPNGDYDFESIAALDIDLFNEDIRDLYEGKAVHLPTFHFTDGSRTFRDDAAQLESNSIVVVEGLHALNDDLSRIVPRYEKIKIYLGALTQLAINDHNRISTSDTRLVRRLVRDFKFRGANAQRTFKMWRDVRKGEETNIFPFQEDADIIFNSALIYELPVLKKEAMPLLESVSKDDEYYPLAHHLIRFLSPFKELDGSFVPKRSLLREFIGNDN